MLKPDIDILSDAYESTITQMYTVFFNAMASAQYDKEKADAEQAFRDGVQLARVVLEKAKQLL